MMKRGEGHRVAIVIINWNGLEDTRRCLKSLAKVDGPPHEIILVDNGSTDGSDVILKEEFPDAIHLRSKTNEGFTGGNNRAFRFILEEPKYDLVTMLNNDTTVEPDFLLRLVETWESDSTICAVQPIIYYLSRKSSVWNAGGTFNAWLGIPRTKRMALDRRYKKSQWLTGCCMLFSREVLEEYGLLDDRYFAYIEDVDFSFRISEQGGKLIVDNLSKIYHVAGASSSGSTTEGNVSPKVHFLNARNRLLLIKDHCKGLSRISAFIYQLSRSFAMVLYFLVRRRFKKAEAVIQGSFEGLGLKPIT